jgi:hypothetical protein
MATDYGNIARMMAQWARPDDATTAGAWEDYADPRAQWARTMALAPRDYRIRQPMADLGARLRARYTLAEPFQQASGMPTGGFAGYMKDVMGGQGWGGTGTIPPTTPAVGGSFTDSTAVGGPAYLANYGDLVSRARLAGEATAYDPYADTGGVGGAPRSFLERFTGSEAVPAGAYASAYGQDAEAQQGLASMLRQQIVDPVSGTRVGAYRGRIAGSIQDVIARAYERRLATGENPAGFLKWYMDAMHPDTSASNGG